MKILDYLKYAPETAALFLAYGIFRLLPLDAASALGGLLARSIGPHLSSSDTARKNLAMVFPDKTEAAREKIVIGMWNNFGRIMAEYPHLPRITERIQLTGIEHFVAARDSGKPSIFCTAHLANWEITTVMAKKLGIRMHPVYRKPNNPAADWLLKRARQAGSVGLIAKGRSGAKEMLGVMRRNESLGIMLDQKLNEGIAVPFFGRDAMTAEAVGIFALRFNCPIYPAQVERVNGAHFKMTVFPALDIQPTGNQNSDVREILLKLHAMMEDWIRAHPEQWLWSHRRWPD